MNLFVPEWQSHIVVAILALLVGILLENYRSKKPKLPYYLLHSSDFEIPAVEQNAQNVKVYTHSIVIQNIGRAPATNIEVAHFNLNAAHFYYKVVPDVTFNEAKTPSGGLLLKFPTMLPGQSITISYLYTYPFVVKNIHNYVKSDEVAGYPINVINVQQTPKWLQFLFVWLSLFGLIYLFQFLWKLFIYLIKIASG